DHRGRRARHRAGLSRSARAHGHGGHRLTRGVRVREGRQRKGATHMTSVLERSPTPSIRPRRLRATAAVREMVAETSIAPGHLIAPYFVTQARAGEVPGMPGVQRHTPQGLLRELERGLE